MLQGNLAQAPAGSERRRGVRAVVDCPAQLELASGVRAAVLVDLSESGAQVRVSENPPTQGASARLKWQVNEVFGIVVWVAQDLCGIKFDRLLTRELVEASVRYEEVELGPVAEVNRIPVGQKRAYPNSNGVRISREEVAEPEPERRRYFRRSK